MPKLPVVRGRELLRALERDGWYIARTTSHHILEHPDRSNSVPVPNHPNAVVESGTLHSILSMTGSSADRLRDLL